MFAITVAFVSLMFVPATVFKQKNELINFDNRAIEDVAHGAGPETAQNLFELKADVLITGNGPGGNAAIVLERAGVKVFAGAGEVSVREAMIAYKNNILDPI